MIAATEAPSPWRSYERRAPQDIEASSGLARAPYLFGLASDSPLPAVGSSVYVDRQGVERDGESLGRAPPVEVQTEAELARATAELAQVEAQAAAAKRELDDVRSALAETVRSEHKKTDELEQTVHELQYAASRTDEEQVKALARLKRSDYDGRLPNELSGPRSLRRSRRKKARELADAYRIIAGSPLFDAEWYRTAYHDVAEKKLDPALHYILHGAKEGRAPGPKFDAAEYQKANPDVLSAGVNPLVHYVTRGRLEERPLTHKKEMYRAFPWEKTSVNFNEGSYHPLVSVIVPNYNHKIFLADRLNSILNQTYKNLEIILLDDNSSDGSQEILKEFYDCHSDITRLILNDNCSGSVFAQWKKGSGLCTWRIDMGVRERRFL